MRLNCLFRSCLSLPLAALLASAWAAPRPAQKPLAQDNFHPVLKWSWSLDTLAQSPREPANSGQLGGSEALQPATPWPLLLSRAAQAAASNRAADAGAQAAGFQRDQAWSAAWMPRLDAAGALTRDRQKVNDNPTVRTPTNSVSLTATLPIWRAGDRASAQAQAAVAEQAQWQASLARANVARDVSQAYLGLVEASEQQRLLSTQAQLLQEQLRINERRLQGGAGTVLDTLETRTRLDQVRAALEEQRTRATSLRLSLQRLSGQGVLPPAGLSTASPHALPEVVPPLEEALRLASSRNPQVQDALAQVRASQSSHQARRADQWQPTVDAVAGASRTKQVPKLEGFSQSETTQATSVGLQANWALFSGGVQNARVKEAAALLSQAQARLDDAQGQVETNLRDAYQGLAQARTLWRVQQQVEQTATATHEALRKAFVAGLRTNLDVLNAQQQIYAARQNMVSATINALNAQATILALIDQLDADHVAPLSPLFDITPLTPSSTLQSVPQTASQDHRP
jgi:TolC family type I secretion outer membrane protein